MLHCLGRCLRQTLPHPVCLSQAPSHAAWAEQRCILRYESFVVGKPVFRLPWIRRVVCPRQFASERWGGIQLLAATAHSLRVMLPEPWQNGGMMRRDEVVCLPTRCSRTRCPPFAAFWWSAHNRAVSLDNRAVSLVVDTQ